MRTALALVAVVPLAALLSRRPTRADAMDSSRTLLCAATQRTAGGDTFAAMMDEAMRQMDAGMMAPPTGDPDRDFARMMIPHHQGAVDMALAELRFGKDERLRRLAQGIIVEQRQEIALMKSILDAPPPTSGSK